MDKKLSESLGVKFMGSVTFNGPMIDIHDNQHVHIGMQMPGDMRFNARKQQESSSVIPPQLDTPRARELWQKVIAQGWVDEQLQPLLSRSDAALLAARMGQVLGIEGWKPFEQIWNRRNMRQDYLRGMGKKEASEFLDALKKKLR